MPARRVASGTRVITSPRSAKRRPVLDPRTVHSTPTSAFAWVALSGTHRAFYSVPIPLEALATRAPAPSRYVARDGPDGYSGQGTVFIGLLVRVNPEATGQVSKGEAQRTSPARAAAGHPPRGATGLAEVRLGQAASSRRVRAALPARAGPESLEARAGPPRRVGPRPTPARAATLEPRQRRLRAGQLDRPARARVGGALPHLARATRPRAARVAAPAGRGGLPRISESSPTRRIRAAMAWAISRSGTTSSAPLT